MTTRAGPVAMMPAMMMFKNPGRVFAAASLLCLPLPLDLCAQSKERADKVRRQLEREVQGKPAALQNPQEQQRQDPIQGLISQLEMGDYQGHNPPAFKAYSALKKLGVLVLPAIHKCLLDLNPFGIRAALELALEYPMPELYRNLELMLEDRDLGKQILAARVLYRLPPDNVRKHVELAGKSLHPVVRLGALHARVMAGADVKPILTEIKPLLRRQEKDVRNAAVVVLGSIEDPLVNKILEEMLLTWDGELWAAAAWVERTDPSEEAAAVALYDRLEEPVARAALVGAAIKSRPSWLQLRARGVELMVASPEASAWMQLGYDPLPGILERLSKESSGPAPSKATLGRLLMTPGRESATVLFLLTRPHKAEWIGLIEQALFLRNLHHPYRLSAFSWLEATAPERLVARAEDLLNDGVGDMDRLLAERGGLSHVPVAVRYMKKHPTVSRPGLDYLVRHKSDRTSLPLLIDLSRLPCHNDVDRQEAANLALDRWFAQEDIAVALDSIWLVNASFAKAILENVARVATRADIPRIAKLLQVASERLRDWGRTPTSPSAAPSPQTVVVSMVWVLGQMGGRDAVDGLLPLLGHRVREVRECVARTLFSLKGPDRKKILKQLLAGKNKEPSLWMVMQDPLGRTDEEVRMLVEKTLLELSNAAWETKDSQTYAYLKALSTEQGTALALRILSAQKERVAIWNSPAFAALRLLGDQEDAVKFIPQLAQWLRNSDVNLRRAAVSQLGRTYSPKAVPYLLQALKDEDLNVRNDVTNILERFETYRNQVERFGKLTTTEWPEPVKPKSEKKE